MFSTFANFVAQHEIAAVSVITIILAMINRKIRQVMYYFVGRTMYLFVRKTYLYKGLGNVFVAHLVKQGYKQKRFVGELFGEAQAFLKSERDVKHILFRDYGRNVQLFYGRGFFNWVVVSGEPLESIKDKVKEYSYVVYSWRWANDIVKMLDEATESKNEQTEDDVDVNRFVVKRVSGGRFFKEVEADKVEKKQRGGETELADPFSNLVPVKWDKANIGEVVYHNTLQMMSLNPELADVLEEIKFWFNSQEWYEERGIMWRRGYLFHGEPGTGKTMLSRAIAETLNTPLIVFDLASMTNPEFIAAWSQILPKRIVLFEDIDTIFHGRKNINNDELTFDTLLNCLDGADKKQGILTIVTTNHPEVLDPALGGTDGQKSTDGKIPSRPGRIDRTVQFLPLGRDGRFKIAMRILKDEALANKMVDECAKMSPAQLQERCFRLAIDELFKKRAAEKAQAAANNTTQEQPQVN